MKQNDKNKNEVTAFIWNHPVSIPTPSEFQVVISQLLKLKAQRLLILLNGPLGVGKTEFTNQFIHSLGGDRAQSPTFSIHNSYETDFGNVEHVDLYRVKSLEDLESTGFWDLFDQENGIILIEWANRLDESMWPRTWEKVTIELSRPSGESEKRMLRMYHLPSIGS